MKVPLVQSSVSMPSTSGERTTNVADTRYDSLRKLGNSMMEYAKHREAKNADAQVLESMNDLRDFSRTALYDTKQNRRGKSALADEANGTKSVYEDYDEAITKRVDDHLKGIPKRFHAEAKARLDQVANKYRDSFANYQAGEEKAWRKNQKINYINGLETELEDKMDANGEVPDIQSAVQDIHDSTKEMNGGFVDEEAFAIKKNALVANSISLVSMNHGKKAEMMLDDKWVRNILTATQRKTLKAAAVKDQDKQDVQIGLGEVRGAGLDHTHGLTFIQSLPYSDEAKKEITSQWEHDNKVAKTVEAENSLNILDAISEGIGNGTNTLTPADLYSDHSFDVMTETHRRLASSWLKGDKKAGEFNPIERNVKWYEAQEKVISGEWKEYDILENMGKTIDVRDARGLIKLSNNEGTGVAEYSQVKTIFGMDYQKEFADQSTRANVLAGVMLDISQYKEDNKKAPDGTAIKDMLHDNVKGYVESHWYKPDTEYINALQKSHPDIGDPQSKHLDDTRITFREREVMRYQKDKYPTATYSKKAGAYLLGEPAEPDGFFYIKSGAETKRAPIDSEAADYYRSLVKKGE